MSKGRKEDVDSGRKEDVDRGRKEDVDRGRKDVAKGRIQIRGFVAVHGRTWEHNNNKGR
jgi:hypothetical protein